MQPMDRRKRLVVVTTSAFVLAAFAFGASHVATSSRRSSWKLVNLGTAPGYKMADVQPYGLNDRGEVVGTLEETVNGKLIIRAFVWKNGTMTLLKNGGEATAVNNRGTVIGTPIDTGSPSVGAVWKGSHITGLGTLGGSWSNPLAINERDQIVGDSVTANGQLHAFLWNAGAMTDLGTLRGTSSSSAIAINTRGQIIGTSTKPGGATRGFIWQNGRMTDLGSLFGADNRPVAISDQGVVVGTITTRLGNPIVAFKWERGLLTNLGRFDAPASQAQDINNQGVILVEAMSASGNPQSALILDHGKAIDLGSLGWGLTTFGNHLNDRNQVVGSSFTRSGGRRSFVWQRGKMTALPTYDGVAPPWGGVSQLNELGDVTGTAYPTHHVAGVIWRSVQR